LEVGGAGRCRGPFPMSRSVMGPIVGRKKERRGCLGLLVPSNNGVKANLWSSGLLPKNYALEHWRRRILSIEVLGWFYAHIIVCHIKTFYDMSICHTST
jgi:hypothetical protein